jgi:hypothetical protein
MCVESDALQMIGDMRSGFSNADTVRADAGLAQIQDELSEKDATLRVNVGKDLG